MKRGIRRIEEREAEADRKQEGDPDPPWWCMFIIPAIQRVRQKARARPV